MMIPAMDAVMSKRVGTITGDKFNITSILHDESVEERNNGGAWKQARPMAIQTDEPIDVVSIMNNLDNYSKRNFSMEFWVKCAKLYRIISPEEDSVDNHLEQDGLESEFEKKILKQYYCHF